jgi:hypothetical protein
VSVERDFIALVCDDEEHGDDEPWGLDLALERGEEELLRKKACEAGWTSVRFPGAPWHTEDRCPEHPREDPKPPDDVLEVRG